MRFTIPKTILGLLLAGLLASCTTTSIDKAWKQPDAPATVYRKVLVVAIATDNNLRVMFENIMAETLREHGVAAVPSHSLLADLSNADRAKLQEMARESESDGVVITRALSKAERTNYQYSTGTLQYRTAVEQTTTATSSTTIAMSAVGIAPRETEFELASLQTRFFDAPSAALVWSAFGNVSTSGGGRAEVFWDISALMVKALGKDGVIQLNSKEFRKPSF